MQLLLVRHAIACERDARRWPDDAERPLSPRGIARARKAAQGLKRLGPRPARVLSSPLLRTRQTARILRESASWPEATACAQLRPGVPAEEFLGLLARAGVECVAAVGHEPGLSELLTTCLGTGADAAFGFRKMGAALLSFRGGARAGRARLVWFVPPRVLRAARADARSA
jgi:phosphohistidine phosphatase